MFQIEKIENEHLESQFAVLKGKVEKEMDGLPFGSPRPPTQRWLFHGTDQESIKDICSDGFNRSFGGERNGMPTTAWGGGGAGGTPQQTPGRLTVLGGLTCPPPLTGAFLA